MVIFKFLLLFCAIRTAMWGLVLLPSTWGFVVLAIGVLSYLVIWVDIIRNGGARRRHY